MYPKQTCFPWKAIGNLLEVRPLCLKSEKKKTGRKRRERKQDTVVGGAVRVLCRIKKVKWNEVQYMGQMSADVLISKDWSIVGTLRRRPLPGLSLLAPHGCCLMRVEWAQWKGDTGGEWERGGWENQRGQGAPHVLTWSSYTLCQRLVLC